MEGMTPLEVLGETCYQKSRSNEDAQAGVLINEAAKTEILPQPYQKISIVCLLMRAKCFSTICSCSHLGQGIRRMKDPQRVGNVLQGLGSLQDSSLSIIRLSEPLSPTPTSHRTSDVSTTAFDNPSPESLEADLSHYKVISANSCSNHTQRWFSRAQELFSKLRFSYLEQVTKEKFLRAIVGDPPLIVEHAENIELENQLAEIKAVLKAQKEHVGAMVKELDERGRYLSRRYETISLQTALLSSLPPQIEDLNQILAKLRKQNQSADANETSPALALPATLELLDERQAHLNEVNVQLKALKQMLPRQTRTLENEERELQKLERDRERAVGLAREAVAKRQEGGSADELERKGRWLRGVETGLRDMLETGA